ncbi:MAG: hypothetical protein IJA70_02285, partial [Oscillospiraceae bacterium]|nr:hypothetical protein [Oscillospiraceae bacterium]
VQVGAEKGQPGAIEFQGININTEATMKTEVTGIAYLTAIGAEVGELGSPSSGAGGEVMPISDTYGYIIDLVFKTNASSSNLLLQTAPVDRIYDENNNTETAGHGATMTITTRANGLTDAQVKNLMGAIRVVFFDTETSEVYGHAKLDSANANVTATDVTANLYLYEVTAETTEVEYKPATEFKENTTYYIENAEATDGYEEATGVTVDSFAGGTYFVKEEKTIPAGENIITDLDDAIITELTQNVAKAVSVLVYLDGTKVTNADVAATENLSMSGSLNLQFSSSAVLVPMQYGQLIVTDDEVTEVEVTVNNNTTMQHNGAAKASKDADYELELTLPDGKSWSDYTITYQIGDGAVQTYNADDLEASADGNVGTLMILKGQITGKIVITITENTAGTP